MTDPIQEMGLVTIENIAEIARVDISEVKRWINEPGFPEPVADSPTAKLYRRRQVSQWLLENHKEGRGIPIIPAP